VPPTLIACGGQLISWSTTSCSRGRVHGVAMKRNAPGSVSQNIMVPSYFTCTEIDWRLPVSVFTSA
jgi:hypothetical protein